MSPSIVPEVSKGDTTINIMFTSIIINRETLGQCEVSLSSPRTAQDSEGKDFTYYWATLAGMICCTGSKFTKLLGDAADDNKLKEVLKAHQNEFQISQATDEDGEPIYIQDDPDRPLLKIQLKPHSVTMDW